jgi:aspartyl-tRNA(Asn)/glutamyl-tRNA(Gln) amidotransferase subunit A
MSSAPNERSLVEVMAALNDGSLTSEALVSACLERIDDMDHKLKAWVTVYRDAAMDAARGADLARASGHAVGPLHGIPIAIKDIIDIEGRVTTGGSSEWRERISPTTATLVSRLTTAGMIVLGKTHSVEFAMGGWGTNTTMGTPHNPWDLKVHRAPGGSSSGSGVAVAAGMVTCAIGTDTGGSVRLPSAWNGLSGLKTTVGEVPCAGVLPLSRTLDTPGPMAHSAADTAVLFEILANRPGFSTPFTDGSVRLDLRGVRLGVLPEDDLGLADAETRAAFTISLEALRRLGASVEPVTLPASVLQLGTDVGHIIGIEGYTEVGDLVDDPNSRVDPDIRPRIGLGRGVTAREYLERLRARTDQQQVFNDATRHVDALLCPGTTNAAPVVADIDQSDSPAVYTRFVNFMDWCALTIPNGITRAGLPISLQIACKGHDEFTAVRIGHCYQSTTDWHEQRPEF